MGDIRLLIGGVRENIPKDCKGTRINTLHLFYLDLGSFDLLACLKKFDSRVALDLRTTSAAPRRNLGLKSPFYGFERLCEGGPSQF
ncbi:hypothetical protein CEXT_595921 [Caerostris extrusa]|uniref:Uncharacterized protein n=1 Tax=Caerostris extrusa TaxID=172846 RepID=A0AAV4Y1X1_CAEEX|nr:hypothetical protein CEXT_595921 [Caerostris extrusa]